ncbi:MAG TPA: prepilin-type N-terminal cleavage/methylation domain-containing protein [Terriglobia bacterium]|nr:prepilin-type N-terminal cleavage/methylation domain-containing protein [Terriglobia bacterium]
MKQSQEGKPEVPWSWSPLFPVQVSVDDVRWQWEGESHCGESREVPVCLGAQGFSLLEFLMAMMVLLIGLGGIMGLFMHSMVAMTFAEESLIAKQKAREALECIFTARNTQQVTFDKVRNTGSGTGIFVTGLQSLTTPGDDGLVGTADDGPVESMVMPDGTSRVLNEFQRQIEITDLTDDLRQITVTIRYAAPRGWIRNYQVRTYISRYR